MLQSGWSKLNCSYRTKTFTVEQWMNWTIYFSVYCLCGLLSDQDMEGWRHFVLACRRMCKKDLSSDDVKIADALLMQFHSPSGPLDDRSDELGPTPRQRLFSTAILLFPPSSVSVCPSRMGRHFRNVSSPCVITYKLNKYKEGKGNIKTKNKNSKSERTRLNW